MLVSAEGQIGAAINSGPSIIVVPALPMGLLTAHARWTSKDLVCRHSVAEVSGELLRSDPNLVALRNFKHLALPIAISGDPQNGGVGHSIFNKPGSDYFPALADLHQGVDQPTPFVVLLW